VTCDGGALVDVKREDDGSEIAPPPFGIMRFRVEGDGHGDGPSGGRRRVRSIRASAGGRDYVFRGAEHDVAEGFVDLVGRCDPDLLLSPSCDRADFPLLMGACEEHGIDPSALGRAVAGVKDAQQVRRQGSFSGRIFLGNVFYGFDPDEWGLAGLVERARFSFMPMGLATRRLSNKSIDSRNCFELMRRRYAIPREGYFEEARPLQELVERDRGGITITPEAGMIHENVAALDFDSQYPSIILKDRLSYEAPTGESDVGGAQEAFRLMPAVIEPWLRRRLELKAAKKRLEEGTPMRRYCEERVDALKMILVTQNGIAGCCRNRFGNIVTYEEIAKRSREAMLKAKAVAEGCGFKTVYCDVDSLFVTRGGASPKDYAGLAARISATTGLSMSVDEHFQQVAFLPLKGGGGSPALKRYFGVTFDGRVEARGIEMRRSDVPEYVRDFQRRLIQEVMGRGSLAEAVSAGRAAGRRLAFGAIADLMGGRVPWERLVVRKRLGKAVGEYAANVAQRAAAVQRMNGGADVEEGGEVEFIYVDANHPNPMCRVAVPEAFRGSYDRRAYASMIAEATSTVYRGMGIPSPLVRSSNGRGWMAARGAIGPVLDAWMDRHMGGTQ
ncbi:MAG TPA: DNA polymerase domain-containing protein, partial [Candidatus Methanomethylicus sp.]|nr:DNA polymerase domain-containing protein [Candidatus Methanomethylicus sp.]